MRISDWSSDVCSADLPTIVFPEVPKSSNSFPLDVVGVAWDFARAAARAVADALPVLQRAKTIRVVTITQEKTIDTRHSGEDLAKYLAWPDRKSVVSGKSVSVRVDLGGRRIIKKKTQTNTH